MKMRKVMTVSLSPKMLKNIKKMTKEGGYSSVSEFCRHIIRCFVDKKFRDK
jgi:Arc/MetJ-type ribon-helix-helix transcriptional regulator